jgi:hypothetical protein
VSTTAFLGDNQVLGIIPKALAKENITGKTVGEELKVLTCLSILTPLLPYQVVWAH